MPESAAHCPDGGKFGRPYELRGIAAWLRALSAPKVAFSLKSARSAMEEYIHLQNLILFKKRLTEAQSDAEREVLLKLLADEEAKEFPRKMAFSSRLDLHQ